MALSVVLARQMGVQDFGLLMGWFAVGGLFAIPVNYGLGPLILREAVHQADRGAFMLQEIIGLKMAISLPIILGALLYGGIVQAPVGIMVAMLLTHVIDSYIDLFSCMLRSHGQYAAETRFATLQAALQFFVVFCGVMLSTDPLVVAAAFLGSRLLSLALLVRTMRINLNASLRPVFSNLRRTASMGFHYFVDNGIQSSLQYVDVVLLKAFAGPVAVGNYQAGMKIVVGLTQAINILVNATLPALSKQLAGRTLGWRPAVQSLLLYGGVGAILSVPLFLFAGWISTVLYGHEFSELPATLQLLAGFLLLRFIGAGSGIVLVAIGDQRMRSLAMAAGLLILVAASAVMMPRFGAEGAALSMIITYGAVASILLLTLVLRVGKTTRVVHKAEDA